MAVAAYTYDKLPPAEQKALPNEGDIVAALEWATRTPRYRKFGLKAAQPVDTCHIRLRITGLKESVRPWGC